MTKGSGPRVGPLSLICSWENQLPFSEFPFGAQVAGARGFGQQPVKTWCLPTVVCMSVNHMEILFSSLEMTEALADNIDAAL